TRRPPLSAALFPYTTLFRSAHRARPGPPGDRRISQDRHGDLGRSPPARPSPARRAHPFPAGLAGRCAARAKGETMKIDLNADLRSEEHTSELQSQSNLVCRL